MAKRNGSVESERSNLRPPTQSRSRNSTETLLKIGRRLIEKHGIDDCGMNDVAVAAGSSVGSLYFRFGNKERFVSEVMQRQVDRTREQFASFLDDTAAGATSPGEVIEVVIRWVVLGFRRNQGLLRAQTRRALDRPQEWQPFRDTGKDIVDGTIRLLERFPEVHRDSDWQRQVRIAMQMIFGTLNNILIHRPGPLDLSDPATSQELSLAVIRYLRWDEPRRSHRDRAAKKDTLQGGASKR